MKILVVEDDAALQKFLHRGLTVEGHAVDIAGTGDDAIRQASGGSYDAIILDLTLPDLDGLEVASHLRQEGDTVPIIMLTGRDELPDRLRGFQAGADDYLGKPFALKELLARLHAVTSRAGIATRAERLVVGDLVLDRSAHEVTRAGNPITLTPKEFAVLEYLMENPGRVLTRDAILTRVWDYSFDSYSNVVDTVIRRLRKGVDEGYETELIQTVRGVGYKIKG